MSRLVWFLLWLSMGAKGDFLTTTDGLILTDFDDKNLEYTRGE